MTPLIDVIFLLLLYFMLSSTFLRHGEITLLTATGGADAATAVPATAIVFVQLRPGRLTVNGRATAVADLPGAVTALMPPGAAARAVVSLDPAVTSQVLADALVALRSVAGLRVEVIG